MNFQPKDHWGKTLQQSLTCLVSAAEDTQSQFIQRWCDQQLYLLRECWDRLPLTDPPDLAAPLDLTLHWQVGLEQLSQSLLGEILAIAIPISIPTTDDHHPVQAYTIAVCHTVTSTEIDDPSAREIVQGEVFSLTMLQSLQQRSWQSAWELTLPPEPHNSAAGLTVDLAEAREDPRISLGWLIALPSPMDLEPYTDVLRTARSQLLTRVAPLWVRHEQQIRSHYQLRQDHQSLQVRNQELQQVSQLKSEFLANTSHEIRTPLSSILGFTHLLREQGFNPGSHRHQEYLSIILTSGKHLLALINDILDLSKIEANQLDLNWDQVEVEALCRTVLSLVQEKANDRGLKLELAIAPNLPILSADPLRLKQMLFNLLSNALKFTQAGTVGLRVSCKETQMCFTVWDTGIGIPTEQLDLLFRPYRQLPQTADRQAEGTGLGLALTQKLAELHHGSIEVQSHPDEGSQFTILLPLQPPISKVPPSLIQGSSTYPTQSSPTRIAGSRSLSQPMPSHRTSVSDTSPANLTVPSSPAIRRRDRPRAYPILLVEDNPHNAQLMLAYLCKLGYEITWTRNHTEMWEALKQADPKLILMDIHLPEVDGFTLIQRLRELPDYRTLPIIAQTALAMSGDRERCLEAGATDYVTKPIDLKQLAQVLERYSQSP
ncbi:MAG: ATP-binding protein [Synechococcales bacterium]|nr:ATP-binding protein [Synechococcales bacterium]